MKATLTYLDQSRKSSATFELDSAVAFVGRGCRHTFSIEEIWESRAKQEALVSRRGDTLFIALPWVGCLARCHFSIRRRLNESDEQLFWIQGEIGPHEFMVNGIRDSKGAEIWLKPGDRIHDGFEFVFNID